MDRGAAIWMESSVALQQSEVGEEWQERWLVAGSLGARDACSPLRKSIPDTPPPTARNTTDLLCKQR